MISPHSRPYGSETQIDLRAGVPRVTLESGERSKNFDTKSPVTQNPATTREAKCKAGKTSPDTTIPLLQGQSPALRSSAKQTGLAAIKWLEREQKQWVQRARPPGPDGSSLPGSLACAPQAGGESTHCPCRLGLGGRPGRDFWGPSSSFLKGKGLRRQLGVWDGSRWGQGKLPNTVEPAKS